jgi:hypothetical protein
MTASAVLTYRHANPVIAPLELVRKANAFLSSGPRGPPRAAGVARSADGSVGNDLHGLDGLRRGQIGFAPACRLGRWRPIVMYGGKDQRPPARDHRRRLSWRRAALRRGRRHRPSRAGTRRRCARAASKGYPFLPCARWPPRVLGLRWCGRPGIEVKINHRHGREGSNRRNEENRDHGAWSRALPDFHCCLVRSINGFIVHCVFRVAKGDLARTAAP